MSEPRGTKIDLERLVIRPASEADLPALRDLFVHGMLEGQVPDNDTGADIDNLQEAYFSDDGASGFWVAEYEGDILGMVGVQQGGENVAEVRRLRVHPDYRRRGIGTRLMEQAITFCREKAYLKVILDTRIEREPAIRLFEKFGFTLSRTRDIRGRMLHDFYIDLYREPES